MVVAGTGIPVGATVVSVIEDTSFVLSAAATASATVTLTFGGAVTITGSNFDSILAGGAANVAVTFDGTSATSISVNSLKSIITCTPPAHAAGTITLLITNASGLTASTNFIYDVEPIFTTSAGSLGNFVDGVFTADASAPRIQGTESGVALTTGFQRVTSATDDTVITTALQGLTLQTSGYLTGTLAGTNATTYPFYATAMDNENQRTAPRLFNIISYDYAATGGTIIEPASYTGDFRSHTFLSGADFTVHQSVTVDILIVAGGGGGGSNTIADQGAGGGGAGGYRYLTSQSLAVGTYTITVGTGGDGGADSNDNGSNGGLSSIAKASFTTLSSTGGGGGASRLLSAGGNAGGSGGGGITGNNLGAAGAGNAGSYSPVEGFAGLGSTAHAGGGGGGASQTGQSTTSPTGSAGGAGTTNVIRNGSTAVPYSGGGGGGGGQTSGTGGAGGNGGGGSGGSSDGDGANGSVNTGGGGGAGGANSGYGGAGGSGVVIIRYAV